MLEFQHVRTIAGKGAKPDQFASALRGLCVDRRDLLYAAGDSEIKVFAAGARLLRRWPTARQALSLAVAADGSIWVGEAHQVEIFDAAGQLRRTWRDPARLQEVTALGFTGADVLIADARDRALRRFSPSLDFLNDIGKDNRTRGFLIPNGALDFSVDARGIIHAANPGKHRVERYSPQGELLGRVGRFDGIDPEGFPGCCNPTNVAVAPDGRLFVTEKAGPRAKVLDAAGKLLGVIATAVFDPNCKNMDIALDSRGRVYVADTVKLEILVFEPVAPKGGRS